MSVKITSVSKLPQSFNQVPATVYIIEKNEFKSLGISSLLELLNFVPSVEYAYPHSWLQGGLRGFADNWSKTKLLIDGEEVNLLYTGEAFIGHQFPLEHIARVEVIPGPSSVIYGADAFTGIINLVTRKDEQNSLTLALERGDGDYQGIRTALAVRKSSDKLSWRFFSYYQDLDDVDFSQFVKTKDFSEQHQVLRQTLLNSGLYPYRDENYAYHLDAGMTYRLRPGQDFDLKLLKLLDRDGGGQESPEISFRDFMTRREQLKLSAGYAYQPPESAWHYRLNVRFREDDELNDFNFREPVDGTVSPLYKFDITGSSEWQVNWNGGYQGEGYQLLAGVGFLKRDLQTPDFELEDFAELTPFLSQENSYLYAQIQGQVFSATDQLTLGVRSDHHQLYSSPAIYRLGYTTPVSPSLNLKFMYGEAFRAPTLFELEINENLKPSLMEAWEVSSIYSPNNRSWLQFSWFRNNASELIVNRQVADDDPDTDLFSAFNEGATHVTGAEFQYKQQLAKGLLVFWLSHTRPKSGTDIAKNKLGLRLSYEVLPNLTLGLSAKYTDAIETRYTDEDLAESTLKVSQYFLTDLNLSYPITPKGSRLWFKIRNLTDKENYSANVRGLDPKQFISQGRHGELGLQWYF
ncbi:TonB-dependent receptor plug domain-containing protein [Thalassomonas sp. RHCl1]|uniref:TonB-dependent receptor n=1 Tax=Thalassomonas sp. RHCl1 TaxID=2995320 RepID=UPI00248CADEA|nr:TonB-dependent receptor plug domain-containing protein [Thalassomonas sp. RHCl1]